MPAGVPAVRELLACLLHELVLRHGTIDDPAIVAFAVRLRASGHPLGALPWSRLDAEEFVEHGRYFINGEARGRSFGPYDRTGDPRPAPPTPPPGPIRDVTGAAEPRICAAVSNWRRHSNGPWQARVFALPPSPLVVPAHPGLLATLPLDAVAGATPADVVVQPATVYDVFEVLFGAASGGGAYSGRLHGAYGRLLAWRSLAGLTGAAEDDPVERVADLASASGHALFSSRSGWYRQIAWDVGIATLRPDRRTLAVLTATDED
jgi:hypothetical protein